MLIYYLARDGLDPTTKNNTRSWSGSTNKTQTEILAVAAAGGGINSCHCVSVSQIVLQHITSSLHRFPVSQDEDFLCEAFNNAIKNVGMGRKLSQ
jgi:hypothetical protein